MQILCHTPPCQDFPAVSHLSFILSTGLGMGTLLKTFPMWKSTGWVFFLQGTVTSCS